MPDWRHLNIQIPPDLAINVINIDGDIDLETYQVSGEGWLLIGPYS